MPSHSGGWPCQLAHPAWAPPKKVSASQATSVKDGPMPQLVGCNPPPFAANHTSWRATPAACAKAGQGVFSEYIMVIVFIYIKNGLGKYKYRGHQ